MTRSQRKTFKKKKKAGENLPSANVRRSHNKHGAIEKGGENSSGRRKSPSRIIKAGGKLEKRDSKKSWGVTGINA